MTITIVTPAECNDFTTLDAVKTYFNINDNSQDAKINQGIKYASDLIRRYTGRLFAEETLIETVRGYGTNYLSLQRYPITNIAAIMQEGEVITDYEISDPNAGLLFRKVGWDWSAASFNGISADPVPNSEAYIYSVQYTGGYCMPCAVGCTRTLPYDIEQAAIELIGMYMDTTPLNVSQIKVGDYSTTYRAGIPASITGVLNQYVGIVPGG